MSDAFNNRLPDDLTEHVVDYLTPQDRLIYNRFGLNNRQILNNTLRNQRNMEIQDEQSRGNAQRETQIDRNKKREIFNILDYISPTPLSREHDVLQRDFQPPQTIHDLLPPDVPTPLAWAPHPDRGSAEAESQYVNITLAKHRADRRSTDLYPYLVANETNQQGTRGGRPFKIVYDSFGKNSYYIMERSSYNGDPDTFNGPNVPENEQTNNGNTDVVRWYAFKGTHFNVIPDGWYMYEWLRTAGDYYYYVILKSDEARERWWTWVYDNIGNNNIALDKNGKPRIRDVGIYSYTSDTGSSFNRTHYFQQGDDRGIARRAFDSTLDVRAPNKKLKKDLNFWQKASQTEAKLSILEHDIKEAIEWYNSKYGKNISIPPFKIKGRVIKKRPFWFKKDREGRGVAFANYIQSLYDLLPDGTMGDYYKHRLSKRREDPELQRKQARELFKGEKMKEHLNAVLKQIDKKEEEMKWKLNKLKEFESNSRRNKRARAAQSRKRKNYDTSGSSSGSSSSSKRTKKRGGKRRKSRKKRHKSRRKKRR